MTTKAKAAGKMGARFRATAWLLLVAFTLQSFITQTHIHGVLGGAGDGGIVKTLASAPLHNTKAPAGNTADCPFCQAIAHAGAFFMPSAPTLILLVTWVAMLATPVVVSTVDSFSSHPWHSRAPPPH